MNHTLRAAAGLLPGKNRPNTLPERTVTMTVQVDRAHLAAYDRVCGFRLTDQLPVTYPHVLAFGLTMDLMTGGDFPFPAIGLVHVGNRITQVRPIDAGETLNLSVRAGHLRDHHRGRQFDLVTTASIDGRDVWHEVSTYLRKQPTDREPPPRKAEETPRPATAKWRVPVSIGSDYAAVSGDRNPIHTSRLGARLFGFPRPIAHGMWSMARSLAALEGRLPAASTVDVTFRAPILLPATVSYAAAQTDGGWEFTLSGKRTHLAGQVTQP